MTAIDPTQSAAAGDPAAAVQLQAPTNASSLAKRPGV